MNNIVTAKFTGEKYIKVYDVYQWDYGQILRIEGLKLPKMVEVHFSLGEASGEALVRIGTTKDGVTDVTIPDSMLENEGAGDTYWIYAWVYLADKDSGSTEYKIIMHVKGRAKPEIPHGGDDGDTFHEVVEMVKESAERAEEAQKQAEGYAHGREDLPERAEDNAMYYAGKAAENAEKTAEDRKTVERVAESVKDITEQVDKVEKLSKDAQEAATQAGTYAGQAGEYKQAAETANSAAQAAAEKTEADKMSVEKIKTDVENLSMQVQKNKDSVDKTTQDFALTAQQALADVNNAGQTQTERVQTAGTTAVEDVKTAQSTATKAVETAKIEAIKAVQTEGNKQAKAVADKGKEVLQSIPEDFTTQMETKLDKNQGAEHAGKALVVGEDGNVVPGKPQAEGVGDAADAIVSTTTGNLLLIKDSAERKNKGFAMSGKTEQTQTTGKNLLNIPGIDANTPQTIIECNISKDICISVQEKATTSKEVWRFAVTYKDGTKKYITDSKIPGTLNATTENPIVNITYRGVYITSGAYTGIMVEYGTTATAYEPYTGGKPSPSQEYPQEIVNNGRLNEGTGKYEVDVKITGKNLFDKNKMKVINANLCVTEYADGIIKITSKTDRANSAYAILTNDLHLKAGITYHVSGDIVEKSDISPGFCFFVAGKIGNLIVKKDTYTPEKDINVDIGVYLCGTVKIDATIRLTNIMVSMNNAEKYEPYKEQTLTITSDRSLSKWDRLVEQGGQIGWLYNSVKETIDGKTGRWSFDGDKKILYRNDANYQYDVPFCNELPGYDYSKIGYKRAAGITINVLGLMCITLPAEVELTLDAYKQYLSDNPIHVLCGTKQTEFVPLPKEEQEAIRALSTYYPTTVVTNSEDMEMELSYIADTKNFILGIAESFAQKQLETNRLILERTI